MDTHAIDYFSTYAEKSSHGHFHRVVALHDEPLLDWFEASELAPKLCRGWYELALLSAKDRIEFVREFWISKLPYHPKMTDFITHFFDSLDDIGVFLTQKKFDDPFCVTMVYSLENNNGFFHGEPPADDNQLSDLQQDFSDFLFPNDYLSFLQIHNGFSKLTDTGIIASTDMKSKYDEFQLRCLEKYPLMTKDRSIVNTKTLIPFYQSFGQPFYQCFWGEWYPDHEMGNVYYSETSSTIYKCKSSTEDCTETMAFKTFTDWLMFYLEKIE